MIKLKLIFTRPVVIPAMMGWYEGVGEYLKKEVGFGMIESVFFFQNGVLKTYRSDRELKRIKKFILENPKLALRELQSVGFLSKNLERHKNILTQEQLKNNPHLLSNFYKDYLASWKAIFFAYWTPQLLKEEELKNYGKTIFELVEKLRKRLDSLGFATEVYMKIIRLIGKDKNLLSLCANNEIEKYLKGSLMPRQRKQILERKNGWIVFGSKTGLIKTFDEAQRFVRQYGFVLEKEEKLRQINEFTGQIASKGKAKGKARLLFRNENNKKVKNGDILVSPMTTPAFMPAIRKCSAIITDEGGITCHAAIVSRELNKPCIIGTKIATRVLKDGDLVEVDANKGIVRKLS